MTEWFMAAVLKTADVLKHPWVRIPLSPPSSPLESEEKPQKSTELLKY